MNDLTIIYYTANTIPDFTGQRVRGYLLATVGNRFPIISVSQKPIDFGQNICVGPIGKSKYNAYKQILIGVKAVKTKYVATVDDDALYPLNHFAYRPPENTFAYDTNMWFADEKGYYWQRQEADERRGMYSCITQSQTLLDNLTQRYAFYPQDPLPNRDIAWGEPGTLDFQFKIKSKYLLFASAEPTVVFRYRDSMGGGHLGRFPMPPPQYLCYNLKPFGGIRKLLSSYWV